MESIGLFALVGSLALGGLLISYRLASITMRLVRWGLLKRTSMVLPAVRPEPRSPYVPVTSRYTTPHLPREVVAVRSTPPPA